MKEKVVLAGARGRMGTLVARAIAESDDMGLVAAIDPVGGMVEGLDVLPPERMREALVRSGARVLVDFTNTDAAYQNAMLAAELGVNLVVGTTGLSPEQLEEVRGAVQGRVAAVVAPNFALGVNVLLAISRQMAGMLGGFDVEIIETHHRAKRDAPSGTAMALYQAVLDGRGENLPVKHGRSGLDPRGEEVGVHAVRGGDIVGEHTVLFAGAGERLELTHRASSRQGFVDGALHAVRWLRRRPPGLYTMADVLGL